MPSPLPTLLTAPDAPTARQRLAAGVMRWVEPVPLTDLEAEVEALIVHLAPEHPDCLVQPAWLERACLGEREPRLRLVRRLLLDDPTLQIEGRPLGARHLQALFACPDVRGVEILRLPHKTPLTAIRALAASPHLGALHTLKLDRAPLGAKGARALAEAPHLGALAHLSVGEGSLDDQALAALVQADGLRGLTTLHAEDNGLTRVEALASAWHLYRLEALSLRFNRLGPSAGEALARALHWRHLKVLALSGNPLGDEGISAALAAPWVAELERLDLSRVGLRQGTDALHRAGSLPLRVLDLSGNQLNAEALRRSLGAIKAPMLHRLKLAQNPLGPEGVETLVESGLLPGLETLDLTHCGIGEAGAVMLAMRRDTRRLQRLNVDRLDVGERGRQALMGSPWLSLKVKSHLDQQLW